MSKISLSILALMVTLVISTNPALGKHHHHHSPTGIKPRIYGGVTLRRNEYPYLIIIYEDGAHRCGGSLYDKDIVLTAAHCIFGRRPPSSYTVVAGEHDLTFTDGREQTRNVVNFAIHTEYSTNPDTNDVALLKLDASFTLNSYVRLVTLTPSRFLMTPIALIMGWGYTQFGTDPAVPQKLVVPLVSRTNCKTHYTVGPPEGTLCFGGIKTMGACVGDSGGPLMCGLLQCGILSYGTPLCGSGAPEVYTVVPDFLEFIRKSAEEFP